MEWVGVTIVIAKNARQVWNEVRIKWFLLLV